MALEFFPVLNTNRLDLIEINQSHLSDLYKLFCDENVTRYYNLLPFKNEQQAQTLLDFFYDRFTIKSGIRWGIALKGQKYIIGTIGFNNFAKDHRASIGYDIQPDYWNNGYMTEALRAVIDFGFNHLEVNRIEAEVMQGNISSEKLLYKLNFTKEGVLRQWMYWNKKHYDMSMFSLLKMEYSNRG